MPHTEIQSRKVISSYGGVGSIIETPVGAMIIEDFDMWRFYKAIGEEKLDKSDYLKIYESYDKKGVSKWGRQKKKN